MNLPMLIVVTGRPGSGKTTLAHTLARTIRCPTLCRDEFKEGLVNTVQEHAPLGEHAQLQVYETFFQAIELLLSNSITLVAEAAFQHKVWVPKLEQLQAIAQIRLVICSIDPALAQARFIQRSLSDPERARYHDEQGGQAIGKGIELLISNYAAPRLAVPTMTVDTSDGYRPTFEQIVAFAKQREGQAVDISQP